MIYRCDRCKDVFEKEPKIFKYYGQYNEEKSYDLCPDCDLQLRMWLQNKAYFKGGVEK